MQTAAELKARLKESGEGLAEPTRIRLHRSISWLGRAEAESGDGDARYLFLWIAFNAAYAQEFGFEQTERELLRKFLARLLALDSSNRLHGLVFEKFNGPVRLLIDNKFVFEPFWRALREHDGSGEWERRFATEKKTAFKAVMSRETLTVLAVIFDRLYILRNQLVHGGATWNSKVNRGQVKDGANLLGALVPAILELMLDHPDADFGGIEYPVI